MASARLDFSSIENPLGTPASLLIDAKNADAARADGCSLEELVAREQGLDDDAVIVAGSLTDLIAAVVAAFAPSTVALPFPLRPDHAAAARAAGHKVVGLSNPTSFVVPDPAYAHRCGYYFDAAILANPSYPTSRLLSKPTLLSYLEICDWVVVDERSIELSMGSESMAPLVAEHRNLIVVQTLSVSFALKDEPLSFAIAHPETLARIAAAPTSPQKPPYAEALGHAAFASRAHLDSARECLDIEIPWMQCMLNLMPGIHIFPAEANYVLCLFSPGPELCLGAKSAPELAEKLAAGGYLVRRFSDMPPLDERFFCVAVRTHEENTQLIAATKAALGHR